MPQKTTGIISAGHPATAEAAALMLEAGGNAFDAATAALFATFVAEPCMSSVGGGSFMTALPAGQEPVVLDFFVQTPRKKRPAAQLDFFPVEVDFGTAKETFHVGLGSMAVPGSLAGAVEMNKQFGRLPFRETVQPAIELAKNGALVDDFQAHDFTLLEPILQLAPETRDLFFKDGKLVQEGDILRMPGFKDFLEVLAIEGADLFYKGEVGAALAEVCAEKGGLLTREDMENYQVIRRAPASIRYRGHRVVSNPFPSIGGSLLEFGLAQLGRNPIDFAPQSAEQLNRIAQVLRDMDLHHHDPAFIQAAQAFAEKRGSTTHFNILDDEGNAVAVTSSNGEGCGYVLPGTDIQMNNMLGEAALLPQGFHHWPENIRLSSMMAPTLVIDKEGRAEVVTGSGGAGRIPGAILQVLHALLDQKLPVEQAVNGPRMHWRDGTLNLEHGFPAEALEVQGLKNLVDWQKTDMFFGGVHTIFSKNGGWTAAGDHRRSGVVREVK